MIPYLLLLCSPIVSCGQSIAQKQYNLRSRSPNVILFSALTTLCALAFFLVSSGLRLDFDSRVLPYSLAFAVSYAAAWVGTVLALRYGSLALSSLIVSFSLIFPTLYGVLLGEAVSGRLAVGIALLLAALALVNLKRGEARQPLSWKWGVCVGAAFLGNGVCSVASNMQKRALGEAYAHEFMICALLAAFVLLMAAALFKSHGIRAELRNALPYAAANGVCNALLNLIILTLIGRLPNTVLYPTNSALNMVFTFLLAHFAYRERFSAAQYAGYALGVVSVALLNL